MRFQMEKEILERVQGHPNIVELLALGRVARTPSFIPPAMRDRVENDFMILELLDMSLEERLKGTRNRGARDDLLALPTARAAVPRARLPGAGGHARSSTPTWCATPATATSSRPTSWSSCPTRNLRGSHAAGEAGRLQHRQGRATPRSTSSMTPLPGASPARSTSRAPSRRPTPSSCWSTSQQGSHEVEYFEDFYIDICENDTFSLFNRPEHYPIVGADRARKRLILATPFAEPSETNVRAKMIKASAGRRTSIRWARCSTTWSAAPTRTRSRCTTRSASSSSTSARTRTTPIAAYIEHEYSIIQNLRAPKNDGRTSPRSRPRTASSPTSSTSTAAAS